MLKELRMSVNMTQEELAKKLNVTRSTISMWETGNSFPRTDKLFLLAQLLNCTVDELLSNKK